VQELGWDSETDAEFRDAVEAAIADEMVDEDSDEIVDAVLLWYREGDGDLVDALVDAITPLADNGFIWLLTPKRGRKALRRAVRHRRGGAHRRPVPDVTGHHRLRLGRRWAPPRRCRRLDVAFPSTLGGQQPDEPVVGDGVMASTRASTRSPSPSRYQSSTASTISSESSSTHLVGDRRLDGVAELGVGLGIPSRAPARRGRRQSPSVPRCHGWHAVPGNGGRTHGQVLLEGRPARHALSRGRKFMTDRSA